MGPGRYRRGARLPCILTVIPDWKTLKMDYSKLFRLAISARDAVMEETR